MNTQEIVKRNSFIDWFSYQSEWIRFAIKKIVEIFKLKTYSYFDNSNLFIEGQRLSAVKKGMAKNIFEAMNNKVVDFSWQPDYVFLHSLVCKSGKEYGVAKMWGSPPPEKVFWDNREKEGFEVIVYDRKYGKEKKVDTGMDVEIIDDSHEDRDGREVTLPVSGRNASTNDLHVVLVEPELNQLFGRPPGKKPAEDPVGPPVGDPKVAFVGLALHKVRGGGFLNDDFGNAEMFCEPPNLSLV